MRGKIKVYSLIVNAGVIDGDDGKTYGFSEADWKGNVAPLTEEKVTFDGNSRQATRVSSER